jgi:hypothetical protein
MNAFIKPLFCLFALLAVATGGCAPSGKELARLSFQKAPAENAGPETRSASLDLKSGEEVAFWCEIDADHRNDLQMRFSVEVMAGEERVGNFELDPCNASTTLDHTTTTLIDEKSESWIGKMDVFKAKASGKYTFKVAFDAYYEDITELRKADLVIRK